MSQGPFSFQGPDIQKYKAASQHFSIYTPIRGHIVDINARFVLIT